MALMEIVKWPAPVLDTPADPVTEFDKDLERLVSMADHVSVYELTIEVRKKKERGN